MGMGNDIERAQFALSGQGLRSRVDKAENAALGIKPKKKKKRTTVAATPAPAGPNAANTLAQSGAADRAARIEAQRQKDYAAGQAALAARRGLRR